MFGSHTFVPISWMCKKQTAVSHSTAESEIVSPDAGSRTEFAPHPTGTGKKIDLEGASLRSTIFVRE